MNHRWSEAATGKDGKPFFICLKCNIKRKRHTFRTVMAIVNHPPWEVVKYETEWIYWNEGDKFATVTRPNCKR